MAGWVQVLLSAAAVGIAVRTMWGFAPVVWLRMKIGQPLWAEKVRGALAPELDAMHGRMGNIEADQSAVKTSLLVALGILGDLSELAHRELNHNGGGSMKDQAVAAARVLAPDEVGMTPTTREALEAAAHKLRQQAEADRLATEGRLERRRRTDG